MSTRIVRHPAQECPHCRARLDASTHTVREQRAPKVGDVTVCLYCARLCIFEEGPQLRAPTAEEREELMASPQVLAVIAAVKRYGPRRPGGRK